MNCPGSVAAEARNPNPRGSSIFAMEGTAAHLLCELYAGENLRPEEFLGETIYIWQDDAYLEGDLGRVVAEKGTTLAETPDTAEFLVEQDMIDAVEYFVAAVEAARAAGKMEVLLKAERRVRHRDVARVMQAADVAGMKINLAVMEPQ